MIIEVIIYVSYEDNTTILKFYAFKVTLDSSKHFVMPKNLHMGKRVVRDCIAKYVEKIMFYRRFVRALDSIKI